jgi:hypothetical protein
MKMPVTIGTAMANGHQRGERRDGVNALKLPEAPASPAQHRQRHADPKSNGQADEPQ